MASVGQCQEWLEQHSLELVEVLSADHEGVHVRVQRKDGHSPSQMKKPRKPESRIQPKLSEIAPAPAPSPPAKSEKPTSRTPARKKVAKKKNATPHPTVQEEENVACREAAALEERVGNTVAAMPAESMVLATTSEWDEGSSGLQSAAEYAAAAAALRAQVDAENAAVAKEWETLDMIVGTAIIKKKLKAKQLVNEWDRKGKGEVSKVEFRQGVTRSLGVKAEMKAIDGLFDSFDDDGGGTLDVQELQDALNEVKGNAEMLKSREVSLKEGQVATVEMMHRLETTAEATRKANKAVKAEASDADDLVKEAKQLQDVLAAEKEAKRKMEEEERAAAEAARAEKEKAEQEERQRAEAAAAALAEAAKKRAEEDAAQLVGSQELKLKIKDLKATIKSLDPSGASPTLEQQLGQMLVKRNLKPKDLVLEWDRKHTGAVGKIEFRQGVRTLGVKADNKDIDALFATLDDDGGGTLDADELKEALRMLQQAASTALEQVDMREQRQMRLKSYVVKVESSMACTETAELALAKHAEIKELGGTDAEIDAAYTKAADLKRSAIQLQLQLAETEKAVQDADLEAEAEAQRRQQARAEAEAVEKAKQAEKKRKAEEEERRRKAERDARIKEQREKATFGAGHQPTLEHSEDASLKALSQNVAATMGSLAAQHSTACGSTASDTSAGVSSTTGAPAGAGAPAMATSTSLGRAHESKTDAPSMDELKQAFDAFDKDNSGSIDAQELGYIMSNLGATMTEAELETLVREADGDGNGTIEFDEFVKMMSKPGSS